MNNRTSNSLNTIINRTLEIIQEKIEITLTQQHSPSTIFGMRQAINDIAQELIQNNSIWMTSPLYFDDADTIFDTRDELFSKIRKLLTKESFNCCVQNCAGMNTEKLESELIRKLSSNLNNSKCLKSTHQKLLTLISSAYDCQIRKLVFILYEVETNLGNLLNDIQQKKIVLPDAAIVFIIKGKYGKLARDIGVPENYCDCLIGNLRSSNNNGAYVLDDILDYFLAEIRYLLRIPAWDIGFAKDIGCCKKAIIQYAGFSPCLLAKAVRSCKSSITTDGNNEWINDWIEEIKQLSKRYYEQQYRTFRNEKNRKEEMRNYLAPSIQYFKKHFHNAGGCR